MKLEILNIAEVNQEDNFSQIIESVKNDLKHFLTDDRIPSPEELEEIVKKNNFNKWGSVFEILIDAWFSRNLK